MYQPQVRRRSALMNPDQTSTEKKKVRRSLQFSTVEIRAYERVLGDNPACTCGPPTQLGWDYSVELNKSLDDYEEARVLRPKLELALTPFMRRYSMHNDFGFSHEEITGACKDIQKIRRQRARSKRSCIRAMKQQKFCFFKLFKRVGNTFRRNKIHYGVGDEVKHQSK